MNKAVQKFRYGVAELARARAELAHLEFIFNEEHGECFLTLNAALTKLTVNQLCKNIKGITP